MTTGGIVDHDPVGMTFVLPPERAAWLTRAAGPENLALQAQYVGLLAQVEDQIVGCFRHGGGVPYSEFPKLQAIMAKDSGAVHATMVDITLPLVPGLVEHLQRGIDDAPVSTNPTNLATAMPRLASSAAITALVPCPPPGVASA
jgi:hypothetical protein